MLFIQNIALLKNIYKITVCTDGTFTNFRKDQIDVSFLLIILGNFKKMRQYEYLKCNFEVYLLKIMDDTAEFIKSLLN